MKEITESEYEELQDLRQYVARQKNLESAQSLTFEQDIDAPIKRCVMALALLGCEPYWSCCGFDYFGQSAHKKHQENGLSWVVLRDNDKTRWLAMLLRCNPPEFSEYVNRWHMRSKYHYGDSLWDLWADTRSYNTWPDTQCIHYSEPAVIAIANLEKWLMRLSDHFQDKVILHDTNAVFKERFSNWQYPTKADWIVRKVDL